MGAAEGDDASLLAAEPSPLIPLGRTVPPTTSPPVNRCAFNHVKGGRVMGNPQDRARSH